jgi:hypothetical protein
MKHCAVAICSSPGGASYHRFPKDPKLRKAWVLACKRKDDFNQDEARICENHFLPSDFERDFKNELLHMPTRKILKKGSIPTLNLLPNERKRLLSSAREERLSKKQRKDIIDELCSKGILKCAIEQCFSTEVSWTTWGHSNNT